MIIKFKAKMNESRPKLNRYKIEAVGRKHTIMNQSEINLNIKVKSNGRTNHWQIQTDNIRTQIKEIERV